MKIKKYVEHWAIPNLTLYLLALQIIGTLLIMGGYVRDIDLNLVGDHVLSGEWTRLFSFMMRPRFSVSIWLIFAFYILYMMGSALEKEWGTLKYNLYILVGYLLTVAMAFVNPFAVITNYFFLGGIFLAFATLFPNIEFRLFFILPVKVKWLGFLTVAMYIIVLFSSSVGSPQATGDRLCVIAAFITYILFFGKGFLQNIKAKQRRDAFAAKKEKVASAALHTCSVCGVTDKSDVTAHFRYCDRCGECFCDEHLASHDC